MTRDEAIFSADEDFYKAHPEYVVDGKRVPLTKSDSTEEPLRKEWMASYKAYLAMDEPCNDVDDPVVPCPNDDNKKIKSILIKTAASRSDHGVLKDNYADWWNNGDVFTKPEFDQDSGGSRPTTQTSGTPFGLDLNIEVGPADAGACEGVLTGKVGGTMVYREKISVAPGKTTISTDLRNYTTPAEIDEHTIEVDYKFSLAHKDFHQSVKMTCFSIFDIPREKGAPEDGSTIKRINAAMEALQGKTTDDIPVLVGELFGEFKGYVLGFDSLPESYQKYLDEHPAEKKALEAVGYSHYLPKLQKDGTELKTSAWHMHDFKEWSAECQAIVRYVRAVLLQVGCPGTIAPKFVNANASRPYEQIIWDTGRRGCEGPDPKGKYALVDKSVVVGELYNNDDPDERKVGFNRFEAYLHLQHDGKDYWFGGGLGAEQRDEDRLLLSAFRGLVEYKWERVDENGVSVWKRKILKYWSYEGK